MLRRLSLLVPPVHRRAASFVSVDGVPTEPHLAAVSVFDTTVQRGNGAFEVVRVLPGGRLRAPELHLKRLERTADALELLLPSRTKLLSWLDAAASAGAAADSASGGRGEGAVRLIATRGGSSLPVTGSGAERIVVSPRVFILFERLPNWPASISLLPLIAPWHPAGAQGWETAKWLSYGPNVSSTRRAQKAGHDDALLLANSAPAGLDGSVDAAGGAKVLDGPNFAVGWFRDGASAGVEHLWTHTPMATFHARDSAHLPRLPLNSIVGWLPNMSRSFRDAELEGEWNASVDHSNAGAAGGGGVGRARARGCVHAGRGARGE